MNLNIETGIPAVTVFLQGLLSFLSPCVLPLIPLYIGYLSGGAKTTEEDGTIHYKRSKIMLNTLFFILGISFAFFLLGFGFTAVGKFFHNYQTMITRMGGVIILLFGLNQLGLFGKFSSVREHRLPFSPASLAMNPFTALLMGFTFSFAWTPCVGPALASVLIMAASASSSVMGFVLIGVYTIGFVLPFMAVGLFTGTLLEFFKKHQQVVRYTVKIGGILMIFIGIMMFTGWMNSFSSYLSGTGNSDMRSESAKNPADSNSNDSDDSKSEKEVSDGETDAGSGDETDVTSNTDKNEKTDTLPAPDFTLVDQFGNTHTLSDYKGKTVFLNFWATWCPPCRAEMPEIQELYEEYGSNESDVIILGIASPNYGREGSAEDISAFLSENNYSYPVVMDEDGLSAGAYSVSAYPTTFMIDKEGNVFGYVSGQLTKDIMNSIIEQTVSGVRAQ